MVRPMKWTVTIGSPVSNMVEAAAKLAGTSASIERGNGGADATITVTVTADDVAEASTKGLRAVTELVTLGPVYALHIQQIRS